MHTSNKPLKILAVEEYSTPSLQGFRRHSPPPISVTSLLYLLGHSYGVKGNLYNRWQIYFLLMTFAGVVADCCLRYPGMAS